MTYTGIRSEMMTRIFRHSNSYYGNTSYCAEYLGTITSEQRHLGNNINPELLYWEIYDIIGSKAC